MATGAWGKQPSEAIRAPPPPSAQRSQSTGVLPNKTDGNQKSNKDRTSLNRSKSHGTSLQQGGRGGRGGRGRGDGRGHHQNKGEGSSKYHSNRQAQVNVNLLVTGEGTTPQQKAVTRITADQLLDLRLGYLDPPASDFNPPDHCAWKDENRLEEIMSSSKSPSKLGDVSHEPRKGAIKETAPPLEECKPLEVNEETRWKSRIFKEGDEAHPEEGSDEEVLRKALLILNKLSLTKFEKLSDEFVNTGIGRNAECLNGAVGIIVEKAQSEPHFATMYAQLCLKLSRIPMPEEAGGKKAFKKMLLSRCQQEFEENINKKVEKAIEGVDDTEEKEFKAGLVKKKYLGHMRFIGELYKGDLIRLDVMLFCLKTLLEAYEEEKVECFAKLMTTIGYPLEQQSAILAQSGKPEAQNDLDSCWASVREMSASSETSIRIKFMLQDLTEMKEKGWVKRRKEETAKTIAQIHKEVAREEAQARRSSQKGSVASSSSLRRASSMDIRKTVSVMDKDGFVQVLSASRSSGNLVRATSDAVSMPTKPISVAVRRAQSFSAISSEASKSPPSARPVENEYPSLKEIETKAQNLLKEFFVNGDAADAVMSIDELVSVGQTGSEERAAKVVEASVLLVMERKEEDVTKMMQLMTEAHTQGKISDTAMVAGLNAPLDFLSDIEIDAPLAGNFLAMIVAELIKARVLDLDFLLSAPEYFRTDGNPALFGAKVLAALQEEVVEAQVDVIEKLMTKGEKERFGSALELIQSLKSQKR